jgi:hypothetical protein
MGCWSDIKLYFGYIKNWWRNRKNIKKNKRGIFTIRYRHLGIDYQLPLVGRRGPTPMIDKAIDQDGNDITTEMREYYGPYGNFSGINITPTTIGYTAVTIHHEDSETRFESGERITLKN